MGKNKSLGYQIYSAINEVCNLQDVEKRTQVFNDINDTDYNCVGKKEFKDLGGQDLTKNYIFSKMTGKSISEKSKNLVSFIKENYSNVKMVKDIDSNIVLSFLASKNGCSEKTLTAYKNMLYKVNVAITQKFGCQGFYNEQVDKYKPQELHKTNSSRLYTNEQIEKILTMDSKYANELKMMAYTGCRVHELINLKTKDIDLNRLEIIFYGCKGGRDNIRPILPLYLNYFKELVKDKDSNEKLFKLPNNETKTRQTLSNEIRKITKELSLPVSGKNHGFRKYFTNICFNYLVDVKGYSVKDSEGKTIEYLGHSADREDLKKIYGLRDS